jgi:phosphoenolpyruvate carboxykinase (GTP)
MREKIRHRPGIFRLNKFRTDQSACCLWPGYGENLRVRAWVTGRDRGRASGNVGPQNLGAREGDEPGTATERTSNE